MSKIYFLFFILFFILPNKLFSQVNICGQITDKNNKSIEFLEIQLQNKDSIIVKSELTNIEGKFTVIADKGEYLLLVKQIGKIIQKQKINANQDINIGAIHISENLQQLKEVTVISKKNLIEKKVDRLVFNIENSISASGGDAIDALKITPSIIVQDDAIYKIGKGQMSVMIDDRLIKLDGEDLINFLKTIQADNIKSIEVVNTPPSKFDADGNSGIVNIILKKVKKNDLFKASINSSYEQRTYATGSVGGNIISQIKKFNIYSNLNYKDGSYKINENRLFYYPIQLWEEKNIQRAFNTILSGRIGLDYKQDENTEFGTLYMGSYSRPLNKENNNTKIYDNQNQITDFYTKTIAERNKKDNFHSINAHYKKTIDTLGKSITANFDYFITNQETKRSFNNESFINNNYIFINAFTNGNQEIKITTSNIDVELPYSKIKYTFGAKASFIYTDNDFNFYNVSTGQNIIDTNQSNRFNYTENTQAIYLDVEKKIKKWEFKIGLRAENTQTKGYSENLNQSNTNNYFKIYPTIYTTYTANDKNVFSLDYTRRVGRPSYYMSNPFRTYINNFNYTEGNPFIQPEFNNTVQISHTYNDNLDTSISFMYLENGKSQITILDSNTNISKSTYLNFFKVKNYSLNINYTLKAFKWIESNNSANLSYRKTIANDLLNKQIVEQISYFVSSNNTLILNKSKTFFSSIELSYKSSQIINIIHIGEAFNANLGFRYLVLNKNLQFALNFYDLFKTNKYKSYSYSNNVEAKSNNYYDNQFFRISALYKFGNNKINVNEKKRGNESESNRAN